MGSAITTKLHTTSNLTVAWDTTFPELVELLLPVEEVVSKLFISGTDTEPFRLPWCGVLRFCFTAVAAGCLLPLKYLELVVRDEARYVTRLHTNIGGNGSGVDPRNAPLFTRVRVD
jgi:hypothetical protein